MIVRTYGRRSRGLGRTYSSPGSTDLHWSDSYSLAASQVSKNLEILPPRNGGDRKTGVDKGIHGSNSSQESKDLGIFACHSHKAKKAKKVNSDPYECTFSEEVQELGIFGFSKSKAMNIVLDSVGINLSQDSHELRTSRPRKSEANKDRWAFSRRREIGISHKKKSKNKKIQTKGLEVCTATLMETQEFGAMMENVDEVNFALSGLKKGQQSTIRRASLLSLLSICKTSQQQQFFRVQGIAKTILDSTLGISLDDPPSNLAAAALVFLLTSDCEDGLVDSPRCIHFFMKLLKPLASGAVKGKTPSIGSKHVGMNKNVGFPKDSAKGTDAVTTAIMVKVQEVLINCKEMKPRDDKQNLMEDLKMNPKWISLLTMEKACSSVISIEDMFGTVQENGGNFKEKLREFGGLDAVFEVARNCLSVMEECLETSPSFAVDLKEIESLLVLLKCLRIMENATFLNKDNQCHLLGMKGKFDSQRSPCELLLSVIKILSGVSLLGSSLSSSQNEKMSSHSDMEWVSSSMSWSNPCLDYRSSLESTQFSADALSMRLESSTTGSCSGTSNSVILISSTDSQLIDPFAFNVDETEPSKWDLLSEREENSVFKSNRITLSENKGRNHNQQESRNIETRESDVTEEKFNLVSDCLLASVKVLVNFTNNNAEGCQQISRFGGLEILSSLLVRHFPSYSVSQPDFIDANEDRLSPTSSTKTTKRSDTTPPLTDHDLDFLVAILGLLVNLVEKDEHNRSWLAVASVSLDSEDQRDLISVLCTIFLANQGAGEAAGERKYLSSKDEDSALQGEKVILEAYSALVIAFLSMESKSVRKAIAEYLPKQSLTVLVPVLRRFVDFHVSLNMMPPETHKRVLQVVESCRIP